MLETLLAHLLVDNILNVGLSWRELEILSSKKNCLEYTEQTDEQLRGCILCYRNGFRGFFSHYHTFFHVTTKSHCAV